MRRRVAWLAHCRWALTGCGDANSVRDVLRGDGIGSVRFGQLPDRVAAGIDRLFGPHSSATPGGPRTGLFRGACGFSEIDWAGLAARSNGSNSLGLIAYFKHRRFVGYSYGPPYGGPSAPPVRDGLMLATGKGLGLDEQLALARRLYGRVFAVTSRAEGTPPVAGLTRLGVIDFLRIWMKIDHTPGGPANTPRAPRRARAPRNTVLASRP